MSLGSVAVPSDEELDLRRRRRGWWLRVAREGRGLSQAGVAEAIGLSKNSASTVSDWENCVSDPSVRQMEALAVMYGLPLSFLIDPIETDQERLDRVVRRASEQESQDSP